MNATEVKEDELNDQELIEAAEKTADETAQGIDYSKIDYSQLDPSKIPHHVIQQTTPFQGIVGDIQAERQKTAKLAESNQTLLEELQNRDATEGQDPNEPITRGEVTATIERVITKQTEKQRKNETEQQQAQWMDRLNKSSLKLEQELTAEKCGEGLDGKTVIAEGGAWLKAHKPNLFNAALYSDDPAKEMYDLAVAYVPAIHKRQQTLQNNQLLDSIQKGRVSKGGGSIPGGRARSELVALIERPEEDILAAIRKDELGE